MDSERLENNLIGMCYGRQAAFVAKYIKGLVEYKKLITFQEVMRSAKKMHYTEILHEWPFFTENGTSLSFQKPTYFPRKLINCKRLWMLVNKRG